jgi:hypothetical protein
LGRPGHAGTALAQTEHHAGAGRGTGSDSSAVLSASGASTRPSERAVAKQTVEHIPKMRGAVATALCRRADGATTPERLDTARGGYNICEIVQRSCMRPRKYDAHGAL